MSRKLLPLLLLPLLLLQLAQATAPVSAGGGGLTCAAVDSLSRLSQFFARNADSFDADGYFGMSLADMAFKTAPLATAAATAAKVAARCGEAGLLELRRTLARIDRLLERFRSRPDKSQYDSDTYWRICRPMEAIVGHLLARQDPPRSRLESAAGNDTDSVADALMWLSRRGSKLNSYDEKVGDACFTGLLAMRNGRCKVSPTCRRFFLHSRSASGYSMTHQLMYWIVGVEKSCHFKLSDGRKVDRSLLDDACRRIYPEYRKLVAGSHASKQLFDLALEEAFFCSVLGHRDFISDSTTLTLRRMQNERLGCLDDEEGDGGGGGGHTTGAPTGRKLMHDVVLDGVCSAHSSGLAAAYLSMSLRT